MIRYYKEEWMTCWLTRRATKKTQEEEEEARNHLKFNPASTTNGLYRSHLNSFPGCRRRGAAAVLVVAASAPDSQKRRTRRRTATGVIGSNRRGEEKGRQTDRAACQYCRATENNMSWAIMDPGCFRPTDNQLQPTRSWPGM